MNPRTHCVTLTGIVVMCSVCILHSVTSNVYGEEHRTAQSSSPLNESNLGKIVENTGKFSDSDLEEMLGSPTSIMVGGDQPAGWVTMIWEDVSRIELTFATALWMKSQASSRRVSLLESSTMPPLKSCARE